MFSKAKAIFIDNDSCEYNTNVLFSASFDIDDKKENIIIKLAAADYYKLYINSEFVSYGPARCAKNTFRVDELDITTYLRQGKNTVAVWVVNSKVRCFQHCLNDGFLTCEILSKNNVLLYTGRDFKASIFYPRLNKVNRYSFQRAFVEHYDFDNSYSDLLGGKIDKEENIKVLQDKKYVGRKSKYCKYESLKGEYVKAGSVNFDSKSVAFMPRPNFIVKTPVFDAYEKSELTYDLAENIVFYRSKLNEEKDKKTLKDKDFTIVDFNLNATGFIKLKFKAKVDANITIFFDEMLTDGDVDPLRLSCLNVIKLDTKSGEYCFESFEPYTFRYLKIIAQSSNNNTSLNDIVEIVDIELIEVANPLCDETILKSNNKKLDEIFSSAVNTFKFNATDIFMDCPSRERAGWLCDSYFTGGVEKTITGVNLVEYDFIENYCLGSDFGILDKMIPMCYPAEHSDKNFIPNWAMFYVLELENFLKRNSKPQFYDKAIAICKELVEFFAKYENEEFLLEDLPSWVFIEWSAANTFTKNVNFPTNMLYHKMLLSYYNMTKDEKVKEKATKLKQSILTYSFNGTYFVDNAVRENNKLVQTNNITEVCQYYAFFSGIADFKKHDALWQDLKHNFGILATKKSEIVHPANAFIGNYLRLLLLESRQEYELCLEQIISYFYDMSQVTKTLWEYNSPTASLSHGFASYLIKWIIDCILGIKIDKENIEFSPIKDIKITEFSMPIDLNKKVVIKNNKVILCNRIY